ncbi:hypothetical protein GmHk_18G050549 [Glycine max]|nr:hypothetical protein GmHk_18G050549 [Glycine max]
MKLRAHQTGKLTTSSRGGITSTMVKKEAISRPRLARKSTQLFASLCTWIVEVLQSWLFSISTNSRIMGFKL